MFHLLVGKLAGRSAFTVSFGVSCAISFCGCPMKGRGMNGIELQCNLPLFSFPEDSLFYCRTFAYFLSNCVWQSSMVSISNRRNIPLNFSCCLLSAWVNRNSSVQFSLWFVDRKCSSYKNALIVIRLINTVSIPQITCRTQCDGRTLNLHPSTVSVGRDSFMPASPDHKDLVRQARGFSLSNRCPSVSRNYSVFAPAAARSEWDQSRAPFNWQNE